MRWVAVGVAAVLLLGWLVLVSAVTACACSPMRPLMVSSYVRASPGWSVGRGHGDGGRRRSPHQPRKRQAGDLGQGRSHQLGWNPTTTLWFPDDVVHHPPERLLRTVISSPWSSLEDFRPGTQWVVRVHNEDGWWMSGAALPVVGNSARVPWEGRVIDYVDGGNPRKVSLDALRASGSASVVPAVGLVRCWRR